MEAARSAPSTWKERRRKDKGDGSKLTLQFNRCAQLDNTFLLKIESPQQGLMQSCELCVMFPTSKVELRKIQKTGAFWGGDTHEIVAEGNGGCSGLTRQAR